MRKIYSVAVVCVAMVIANSNACLARDKPPKDTEAMMTRLIKGQKKGKIVQVTLKDGTIKWGRAADVSATAFTLLDAYPNRGNMKFLFRYDQVTSVRYEGGWSRFFRVVQDVVTAPIVIIVFTIWGLQWPSC